MRNAGLILTILTTLAAAASQQADTAAASADDLRAAWHVWLSGEPTAMDATQSTIAFSNATAVWRYDVMKQKLEVIGLTDGLPLEQPYRRVPLAIGTNGCMFAAGRQAWLWQDNGAWSPLLPTPRGKAFLSLAYTQAEGLLAVTSNAGTTMAGQAAGGGTARDENVRMALAMSRGGWQTLGPTAQADAIVPLPRGFFLARSQSYLHRATTQPADVRTAYYAAALDQLPGRSIELKDLWPTGHFLRLPRRSYGLFITADGKRAVCLLTPSGPLAKAVGDQVGIDLSDRGFLTFTRAGEADEFGRARYRFQPAEGAEEALTPPISVEQRFLHLRDVHGHVWCGTWRWDGKEWKQFLPDSAFGFDRCIWALDPQKLRLDANTMTWRRVQPNVPLEVVAYDPADRTGWLSRRGADGKVVWDFIRFGQDGRREVIQSVADQLALPNWFRYPVDESWWAGILGNDAARFLNGRLRKYDLPPPQPQLGTLDEGVYFATGSSGRLWAMMYPGPYCRYDPLKDAFVEAEPYQDFLVRAGGKTFAVLPTGFVFENANGHWVPLTLPETKIDLRAGPRAVRGSRMLLSAPGDGLYEYDATGDRWVLLVEGKNWAGAFDEAGRRILTNGACVLAYAGDPLGGPAEVVESHLARLLKDLDDPRWRTRQEATEQLRKLAPRQQRALQAAAEDTKRSLEVRLRLAMVLRTVAASRQKPPPVSLFRRAFPVLDERPTPPPTPAPAKATPKR